MFGITAFAAAIIMALASCGSKSSGDLSSPEIPENVNPENPGPENPNPENPNPENPDPEINFYTVTFDSDGGTLAGKQDIQEGNKAVEPAGIAKAIPGLHRGSSPEGTLAGWYNEDVKWDFDDPVNADITLKAKWEFPNFVDVSGNRGNNIVEKSVAYIKGVEVYTKGHTLFLEMDVGIKPQVLNEELFALTIVGFGGVRTIRLADGESGALFSLGDITTTSIPVGLTLGEDIILKGKKDNSNSVISMNSMNANFLMLDGSKITGNSISLDGYSEDKPRNNGAAVDIIKGTFIMKGGLISGNESKKLNISNHGFYATPSAVSIHKDGIFDMSGGSITGNKNGVAEIAYNVDSKVSGLGLFHLSGDAEIGSVVLVTESFDFTQRGIEIASGWNYDPIPGNEIKFHVSGKTTSGYTIGNVPGRFSTPVLYTGGNPNVITAKAIGKFVLGNYYDQSYGTENNKSLSDAKYRISTDEATLGKLIK